MKLLVAFTYLECYNMKKRGETDSEGAWSAERVKAQLAPSAGGFCPRRSESDRAPRPVRSVTAETCSQAIWSSYLADKKT